MAQAKSKSKPPATKSASQTKSFLPRLTKKLGKTVVWTGLVAVVVILITAIGCFGYEYTYQNKIYPGVYFYNQSLAGKSYAEVADQVRDIKATIETDGLNFQFEDHTLTIPVTTNDSTTPALLTINADDTAQAAYAMGRSTDTVNNVQTKLHHLVGAETIQLYYQLDRAALLAQLQNEFDQYTTPYHNATLVFSGDDITVTPHSDGTKFDWTTIMNEIEQTLANGKAVDLTLTTVIDSAPVTTDIAEHRIPQAQVLSDVAPITLTYEDQTFTIEAAEFTNWITLTNDGIGFDHAKVTESLQTIASEIDKPVKEGKFSLNVVDGKVTLQQFQDGQDGLGVTIDKTIAVLEETILQNKQSTAELVVEVTHPRANPENLDDLGIKELIATGETNFAGSPSNRVYNIKKGADLLNGLLIAPDETFSLLSILSPIDEAHGWKPELVIKEKKLEKEAGGGLCQVGTTSFRAAMLAGLPIVERRNHSWAVSYYNYNGKAGVDATIYEPSPDFKFKNDTGHYILWRSRVEGSTLLFEFWGSSDGRKGSFTTPTNYNYVSPGPAIETLDPSLPPGTRNCDSHVFTGVSASFDYTIEHSDGTKDTRTFTSVYKPQAASCIVGPPKTEEPDKTEDKADTTTDKTNTNTNSSKNTNSSNNTNKTNSNTNSTKNKNVN